MQNALQTDPKFGMPLLLKPEINRSSNWQIVTLLRNFGVPGESDDEPPKILGPETGS